MCLGIPMRIIEAGEFTAVCAAAGERRRVSLLATGPLVAGDWVLVHIDRAVRRLDEDEARRIGDALAGLAAAIDGRAFDHLFADLIDREPQLPAHLRRS